MRIGISEEQGGIVEADSEVEVLESLDEVGFDETIERFNGKAIHRATLSWEEKLEKGDE